MARCALRDPWWSLKDIQQVGGRDTNISRGWGKVGSGGSSKFQRQQHKEQEEQQWDMLMLDPYCSSRGILERYMSYVSK